MSDTLSADAAQASSFIFSAGMRVTDGDRYGKIVAAGAEVCEIQYDDGAQRNIPNDWLSPVEAIQVDGLSQVNPSPIHDVVRRGREAMERKRRTWDDWVLIGEAIEAGRTQIMLELGTNTPHGRRYEKRMADWLVANGFAELDKGTRSRLLDCLKHRQQIAEWLAIKTASESFEINHPNTVWRKWKSSTEVPDPNKQERMSPVARLKTSLAQLAEENHRLKAEIVRGGGDLWTSEDRPRDIARIMLAKLTKAKAEQVAREILAGLKKSTEAQQ